MQCAKHTLVEQGLLIQCFQGWGAVHLQGLRLSRELRAQFATRGDVIANCSAFCLGLPYISSFGNIPSECSRGSAYRSRYIA